MQQVSHGPAPSSGAAQGSCMPHVTHPVCGSLPVVIVGTIRYLPTICFDRPALDANATQLHIIRATYVEYVIVQYKPRGNAKLI